MFQVCFQPSCQLGVLTNSSKQMDHYSFQEAAWEALGRDAKHNHFFCSQDSDPALQQSFEGHKRPVTSVAFNSSKKQIISGALNGSVLIHFQSPDHRPIRFDGHKVCLLEILWGALVSCQWSNYKWYGDHNQQQLHMVKCVFR